jgi:hypothetical protein
MSNRRILIVGIVLALIIATIFFVPAVFGSDKSSVDSGIAACQTIQSNMDERAKKGDGKMSEVEYERTRAPFNSSKHTDIRDAGIGLVDTLYQLSKMDVDSMDLAEAMGMLITVKTKWTGLQVACGNHGVSLPSLQLE